MMKAFVGAVRARLERECDTRLQRVQLSSTLMMLGDHIGIPRTDPRAVKVAATLVLDKRVGSACLFLAAMLPHYDEQPAPAAPRNRRVMGMVHGGDSFERSAFPSYPIVPQPHFLMRVRAMPDDQPAAQLAAHNIVREALSTAALPPHATPEPHRFAEGTRVRLVRDFSETQPHCWVEDPMREQVAQRTEFTVRLLDVDSDGDGGDEVSGEEHGHRWWYPTSALEVIEPASASVH